MTICESCNQVMNNLGGPDAAHQLMACPTCGTRAAGEVSPSAHAYQALADKAATDHQDSSRK